MDNLFSEAPLFIPLSKWTPTNESGRTELEMRAEKQQAYVNNQENTANVA